MKTKEKNINELDNEEILDKQDYKNYFLFYLIDSIRNIKSFAIKLFIAYLVSFIFDSLNLFEGYSVFMSYILIEIFYFNFIDKKLYRP